MITKKFRYDIEILRAIAIVSVILAHSKITLASGFIGVDIFFVISGFLITKHLYDEVKNTGKISIGSFYARRILRILPASMFVILLTLLLSFFLLSPLQFVNYSWDSFFSGFSGINFRLAQAGTDYFATDTIATPFQHFWSLAVEEQFYLFWPMLMFVIAKILLKLTNKPDHKSDQLLNAKNNSKELQTKTSIIENNSTSKDANSESQPIITPTPHSNFPFFEKTIIVVLVGIIAYSLYLSYTLTSQNQSFAYFGIHTRSWQLAIGALLAFLVKYFDKIPKNIATVLSWIGFAGLILGFSVITEASLYPGVLALIPTLSTALIIIAGSNISKFAFGSVFNNRYVRFVGKISYSWYLVHWPMFVFVYYSLGNNVKLTDRLSVILLSFLLAIISYAFVENPIRFSPYFKNNIRRSLALGLVLVTVVSSISYASGYYKETSIKQATADKLANAVTSEALITKINDGINLKELPSKLVTPLELVLSDKPKNDCLSDSNESKLKPLDKCTFGDLGSSKTIILLGDSHSFQWSDALIEFAKKQKYKLIVLAKSGCPMSELKADNLQKRDFTECYSWRNEAFEEIKKLNPELLIHSSVIYFGANEKNYSDFLNKIKQISKKQAVIMDNPRSTNEIIIPECLSKNSKDIQKCNLKLPDSIKEFKQHELQRDLAKKYNINIIESQQWFCNEKTCPPVIDNIVVYQDASHVSNTYAKYLGDLLEKRILQIAPELKTAAK